MGADTFIIDAKYIHHVLESSSEGAIILDSQYFITYANPKICAWLGYSAQKLIGINLFSLIPEKKTSTQIKKFLGFSPENLKNFELSLIDRNNGLFCCTILAIPTSSISDPSQGSLILIQEVPTQKDNGGFSGEEQPLTATEKKLRLLVEQAAESFIVHDDKGKILDVNRLAWESLGYTRQELLNLNVTELDPNFDFESLNKTLIKVKPGKPVTITSKNKRKNGELFPVEIRVASFEEENQKIYLSLIQDISERQKHEEGISQARERLQLAAQSAHMGVWDWDIIHDRLLWDDQIFELYGISRGNFSLDYENWHKLIHPDDANESDRIVQNALKEGTPYETEFRVILANHQIRYLKSYGQVIRDQSGKALRMLGVNYDITESKWVEKANQLMAEAERQMIQSGSMEEVFTITGKTINEMIEEGIVVISGLDESVQGERIKGIFGAEEKYQKIINLFEFDPTKTVYYVNDMTDDELALFASGKLELYKYGLYGLLNRKVPKTICKLVEQEIKLDFIYTMGFSWEQNHYGGATIFTNRDLSPIASLIETAVNQAAVSLKKIRFETLLRESETRFRGIFEESPIGIILTNSESKFLLTNPALSRLLGYSPEELKNITFKEITHPEDMAVSEELIHQLAIGKIPFFETQKRYLHKEGKIIWANVTITAIHSQSGEILNLLVMIEDITERKKAEEAFKIEQYLMQTLMDNIPDSVYFKDLEGRFIRVNHSNIAKFGLQSVDEILGKTDADFFPLEYAQETHREETEIIRTGKPIINLESVEIWKDQRPNTWASITKMTLPDRSGKIIGTFGVTRDITDRKAKEEEIKRLNADLEKKVEIRTKELESFTYSISHDLKAPLRGITGYSQLLIQEHSHQLDDEGKSFLNKLILSSGQLTQLIDDLFSYSSLERKPINWLELSINAITNAVIEERKVDILKDHILLHKNIEEEKIVSSPELLMQIFRNYLDNAIKFSKTMEQPVIWIDYKIQGNTSLFSVRDNGIGFDMKFSEKVFEVFYRLHRIDEYPGTGIGLALVKKAASILGYRVWVESNENSGSTFFLEINNQDLRPN